MGDVGGKSPNGIVILGAVGDLATRHFLPALARLQQARMLPSGLRVVGVDREPHTTGDYRRLAGSLLAASAPDVPPAERDALLRTLAYHRADLTERPDLGPAVGKQAAVVYLALPPVAYADAVHALRRCGLPRGSRLVVEKPFGYDAASARALNGLVHEVVEERDVFRADHFLHHQVVHDLLALRLGSIFAPLWDRDHVERVEVAWEEDVGIGGRADFYDRTGALRDMVQGHLLEVLAAVAMEEPPGRDERSVRDARVAALRAVRALEPEQVVRRTARGRYGAGTSRGQSLRGYVGEYGVDPARGTETYAAVQLEIDTPRWRGVPFLLRTGKALGSPRRAITVRFRGAVLTVEMGPDRVALEVAAAAAGGLPEVVPVSLVAERPSPTLPASARLLRDVLAGDPTRCVRDDEVEECWRIVESVTDVWATGRPPLQDYAAGSDGPRLPWPSP